MQLLLKKHKTIWLSAVFAVVLFSQTVLSNDFSLGLANAAIERTHKVVRYDGSYITLKYPWGDVPDNIGVCTDLVIRSYRRLGYDLQSLVHEDMVANFSTYPAERTWGQSKPDKNIDHRRVPNLQHFFSRHGEVLTKSRDPHDYQPGDIVSWILPGNLTHIGIVTDQVSAATGNPLVAHNIGNGPELDDMLFQFKITGHYQYKPQDR